MENEIRNLQKKFNAAELQGDRILLRSLIADRFVSIGPKGYMLSKDEWINRHEYFTYHKLDSSDYHVQLYKNTGVVVTRHKNESEYQGNSVHFVMRETQVWVNQDGTWQIVCLQFSPIDSE